MGTSGLDGRRRRGTGPREGERVVRFYKRVKICLVRSRVLRDDKDGRVRFR